MFFVSCYYLQQKIEISMDMVWQAIVHRRAHRPFKLTGDETSGRALMLGITGEEKNRLEVVGSGIHQCHEHARTSARLAEDGNLFEKPAPLLLQNQPAAPPLATAPVRHRLVKLRRRVRPPAERQPRMMPLVRRFEASSSQKMSRARVLQLLMSCTLVLLASVWAVL